MGILSRRKEVHITYNYNDFVDVGICLNKIMLIIKVKLKVTADSLVW